MSKKPLSSKPKRKGGFNTLRNVFRHNIPWLWLIGNFIFSVSMGYFYYELPDVTAKVAAGEIFDSSLVMRFILLTVIQAVCVVLATLSLKWVGYFTERNIRKSVWKKLIRISLKDYTREQPSSLISRITADATQATTFMNSIMEGILCVIYLFVVFLSLWMRSQSIALAVMATLPYFFLVAVIPGKLKFRRAAERQDTLADYTAYVSERLTNYRLVRACACIERDIVTGSGKAEACYTAEKRLATVEAFCEPFVYLSQIMINLIVILMGGRMLAEGKIGNSDMVSLYLQGANFYAFSLMTVSMYYSLRETHGATKKIGEIMDIEEEMPAPAKKKKKKQKQETAGTEMPDEGDIAFDKVCFSYENETILRDVSVTIPRGKVTALVGASGSGKSTLLNLIDRLYMPQTGEILCGDTPAKAVRLSTWRSKVGVLQQNCPLLGGTIRDNLLYGLKEELLPVGVSDEKIMEALEKTGMSDFVRGLPMQLDTMVGQLGSSLSGGQKQRLAIARIILRDPEILLLDEPTSSLDAENEYLVQRALEELMQGRTTVIATHNFRNLRIADRVIVLNHGGVEAVGTQEECYAASPTYRKYCELQKMGDAI